MTGETNGPGWYEPRPGRYAPMPRRYAPGQRPHEWAPGLRASDREREAAVDVLKAAFGEGRLTRDELDTRTGQAMAAAYRADLTPIVADLPGGSDFLPSPAPVYPPPYTYRASGPPATALAVGSLVFSLLGFIPFATSIGAVAMGHAARGQINHARRAGQGPPPRGYAAASVGLALGYFGLGAWLLFALFIVAVGAGL